MKVTVEDTVYEFESDQLLVSEAIEVQGHTNLSMASWQMGLNGMEPVAVKGLVFLLKKRAGEKPDWDALDFNLASVEFNDVEELAEDPPGAEPS